MLFSRSMALTAIAAVAFASAPLAVAQNLTSTEFATRATISNTFEIQSSQLALQKAQSSEVRAFAQQMIADHTKAAADMQAALKTDSFSVPLPSTLDEAHLQKMQALQDAPADAFDAAYIAQQRMAHDEAVALFSAYADGGVPSALKRFAAATLPTLTQHKAHVERLTSGQ